MNLQNIKTIFISPCTSKYTYKCFEMKHYLTTHKFKWELHKSELIYPLGLTIAFQEILLKNLNDEPLLILEDDARLQKIIYQLENIPSDADAVYLGISAVGNGHFPFNSASVEPYENVYKINSMRSAHAILYLTRRYKLAIANAIQGKICDIEMANVQHKFNVYGFDNPIFIQNGTDINAMLTKTTMRKIYMERKITVLFCMILSYYIILKLWKFII